MATLILGGIGTLIGGPLGGAIGALAGRQIDAAIIGSPTREGARLKDLSITTSSYGSPIPRHFGTMRVAGTIIWSTELVENRETSGGGKGKPKVASYSYSSSFAVALASRPISGVGRIWADGNLLRGVAGDLKVGGSLRIYHGFGDQPVDPLIAAAQGIACPAFRNRAYVVFEDLQLADFGNRIPALSFEVFADLQPLSLADLATPHLPELASDRTYPGLVGFSHEGGSLGDAVATVSALYPTAFDAAGTALRAVATDQADPQPMLVGMPVSSGDDAEFGERTGQMRARGEAAGAMPGAIRYYDTARDFQPGVQRAAGQAHAGDEQLIEFPGALDAGAARGLIESVRARARLRRETLRWRMAELDSTLAPGTIVRIPDSPGLWLVEGWEWHDGAVELVLARHAAFAAPAAASDPGSPVAPVDAIAAPTVLRAFELPWDGAGLPNARQLYLAAAADTAAWAGAALFAEREGLLEPIGSTGRSQAVTGELASPIGISRALLFEPAATIDVALAGTHLGFEPTDIAGLAAGRNRIMVGDELMQFAGAHQIAADLWRLCGLLRGRGGTEHAAMRGHASGTPVSLVDDRLMTLSDAMALDSPQTPVAAIGRGDAEPVIAVIGNAGLGTRPLTPVHAQVRNLPDGALLLCWTRRARGAWLWDASVETPLNEAFERYRVGIGSVDSPLLLWEPDEPQLVLAQATRVAHAGQPVWVRQIGNAGVSDPLLLTWL